MILKLLTINWLKILKSADPGVKETLDNIVKGLLNARNSMRQLFLVQIVEINFDVV